MIWKVNVLGQRIRFLKANTLALFYLAYTVIYICLPLKTTNAWHTVLFGPLDSVRTHSPALRPAEIATVHKPHISNSPTMHFTEASLSIGKQKD